MGCGCRCAPYTSALLSRLLNATVFRAKEGGVTGEAVNDYLCDVQEVPGGASADGS